MYMWLWCFPMLWHQEPPCWLDYDYRIIRIALHASAVITRSNITLYSTNHCKTLGRISIRGCTHKRHLIPHPDGREYFGDNWPRYNRTIYGSKYMWIVGCNYISHKTIDMITYACPNPNPFVLVNGSLVINTLRPRQNGRHFADDIFNSIFVNENA